MMLWVIQCIYLKRLSDHLHMPSFATAWLGMSWMVPIRSPNHARFPGLNGTQSAGNAGHDSRCLPLRARSQVTPSRPLP